MRMVKVIEGITSNVKTSTIDKLDMETDFLVNQIDTPEEIKNAFNVFINKRNIKPTKKRF